MQARRGLACMCLPEHPQQQFCRADFGKLLTKLFLRKLLNLWSHVALPIEHWIPQTDWNILAQNQLIFIAIFTSKWHCQYCCWWYSSIFVTVLCLVLKFALKSFKHTDVCMCSCPPVSSKYFMINFIRQSNIHTIICLTNMQMSNLLIWRYIVWERWHFWRSEINIELSISVRYSTSQFFCSSPALPIFKLSLQVPWIDSRHYPSQKLHSNCEIAKCILFYCKSFFFFW